MRLGNNVATELFRLIRALSFLGVAKATQSIFIYFVVFFSCCIVRDLRQPIFGNGTVPETGLNFAGGISQAPSRNKKRKPPRLIQPHYRQFVSSQITHYYYDGLGRFYRIMVVLTMSVGLRFCIKSAVIRLFEVTLFICDRGLCSLMGCLNFFLYILDAL